MRSRHGEVLSQIRDSGELGDETEQKLRDAIQGFTDSFSAEEAEATAATSDQGAEEGADG